MFGGIFQGRAADRAFAIEICERHTARVQATVPAERLLVYGVRQAWTPLCGFLEVPVPSGEALPRANDAATLLEETNRFTPATPGAPTQ